MTRNERRELEQRGYTITRGRHWKIYDGKHLVAVAAHTPSGGNRGDANLRAILRRYEQRKGGVL